MIDSGTGQDEFTLVINEEHNCFMLKESFRAKYNQLGDFERERLIEHGKRIGIDEILKQNERQSLKLRSKAQNLLKL